MGNHVSFGPQKKGASAERTETTGGGRAACVLDGSGVLARVERVLARLQAGVGVGDIEEPIQDTSGLGEGADGEEREDGCEAGHFWLCVGRLVFSWRTGGSLKFRCCIEPPL